MAENEAIFRDANEQIERRARELDFPEAVPFICECGQPECRQLVRLMLDDYEAVRADSKHFFVLPGHDSAAGQSARVVGRHDTYLVLEKTGIAGEVASRRDPRQAV